MHKSETIQVNKTHKILWDFEIKMDHQIPPRRPELVVMNKKKQISWTLPFQQIAEMK